MSLKRSEVLKIQGEIEGVICGFLGEHPDEVFPVDEIREVLEKRDLFHPEDKWAEQMRTTSMALENLVMQQKAERFAHRGNSYYGIAQKK